MTLELIFSTVMWDAPELSTSHYYKEDLLLWSQLEKKLNALSLINHFTKTVHDIIIFWFEQPNPLMKMAVYGWFFFFFFHWPVWLSSWLFFYELNGCGFESHCSHLKRGYLKILGKKSDKKGQELEWSVLNISRAVADNYLSNSSRWSVPKKAVVANLACCWSPVRVVISLFRTFIGILRSIWVLTCVLCTISV